jgi:hypothetical protein
VSPALDQFAAKRMRAVPPSGAADGSCGLSVKRHAEQINLQHKSVLILPVLVMPDRCPARVRCTVLCLFRAQLIIRLLANRSARLVRGPPLRSFKPSCRVKLTSEPIRFGSCLSGARITPQRVKDGREQAQRSHQRRRKTCAGSGELAGDGDGFLDSGQGLLAWDIL